MGNNPVNFTDPTGHCVGCEYLTEGEGGALGFIDPNLIPGENLYVNLALKIDSVCRAISGLSCSDMMLASGIGFGAEAMALTSQWYATAAETNAALKGAVMSQSAAVASQRIFTSAILDDALASSRASVGQTTQGARAVAKKLGHAGSAGYTSAFEGVTISQETAEALIRDILTNSTRQVQTQSSWDFYNSVGQGVRLKLVDGKWVFQGLLEASQANR